MRNILSFLLLFMTLSAIGQTQPTKPTGAVPYGSLWVDSSGDVWSGSGVVGYTNLGKKAYVDSLLALKVNIEDIADVIRQGDNVSELVNDAEYITLADLPSGGKSSILNLSTTTTINWQSGMATDETGAPTTETWAQRFGNGVSMLRLYNSGSTWIDESLQIQVTYTGNNITTVKFPNVIGDTKVIIISSGASNAPTGIFINRGIWVTDTYQRGDYVTAPSTADPLGTSLYFLIGNDDYNSTITPGSDLDHWSEVPAAKGEKGDQGDQGPMGPKGDTGDPAPVQTLSLGAAAGNIAISGGNSVNLNSLSNKLVNNFDEFSLSAPVGFSSFSSSGSTSGFPLAGGNGVLVKRNLGVNTSGSFMFWKAFSGNKLYLNIGLDVAGNWSGFQSVATEEWANSQGWLKTADISGSYVNTTGNQTGIAGDKTWTGNHTFSTLSGTGNRMVIANASGTLSTQAIPSFTQVNSDWNATTGVAEILNKPTTIAGYGITDGAVIGTGGTQVRNNTQLDARYLQTTRYSNVISVTANRTVALTDENTYWVVTGTRTITVPTNATVAFPIGARIDIQMSNDTDIANITGASGVALIHREGTGNTTRTGFIVISLLKTGTNEWTIIGG